MQNNDVTLLQKSNNHVTLDDNGVYVNRFELEQERRWLLARLQQIQRILQETPMPTGAMQRRMARNGR